MTTSAGFNFFLFTLDKVDRVISDEGFSSPCASLELTEEIEDRFGTAPWLGLRLIKGFGVVTFGVASVGFTLELTVVLGVQILLVTVVLGVESVGLTLELTVVFGVETVGQILEVTVVLGVDSVGFVNMELLDTLADLLPYGET